jgi:thiol:disulfide interchange protein DsbA
VNPPQPTETGNKVEVLEIFSYACPHCNELEPKINEWVKHLPPNVVYRRMPAVFRDSWLPLAKTFYALEAIGETAKLHEKVFAAIHHENVNLAEESTLFAWVEKQGVDAKKFTAAFNSFGVQSKVQRAIQLSKSYGITGVPSVIVDGKVLTSPSMTGSHESFFPVLNDLVKSAEKDHTAKN